MYIKDEPYVLSIKLSFAPSEKLTLPAIFVIIFFEAVVLLFAITFSPIKFKTPSLFTVNNEPSKPFQAAFTVPSVLREPTLFTFNVLPEPIIIPPLPAPSIE